MLKALLFKNVFRLIQVVLSLQMLCIILAVAVLNTFVDDSACYTWCYCCDPKRGLWGYFLEDGILTYIYGIIFSQFLEIS
jgi:hypothetical protein